MGCCSSSKNHKISMEKLYEPLVEQENIIDLEDAEVISIQSDLNFSLT